MATFNTKNKISILKLLFVLVFILSSILRLGLALVNREAFDDHIGVVNLILRDNRLSLRDDCPECFQPKLFYASVALAARIAPINPDHQDSIILLAQLMNFVVGEIVLMLAYLLIKDLHFNGQGIGLIAFSLLAFNPALIAANGMASNDTFAILLSSLAIYACFGFLRNGRRSYLFASAIFVSLGIATKTNVWSTALAIFLTLLLKGLSNRRFIEISTATVFLVGVTVATFLNPLSQYLVNIQNFGTPVTLNVGREPLPPLFDKTYVRRPGIVSIQDGFFTFKFADLMAYPRLTLGANNYPAHRTSLWTDVYASANSLHFYNFPASWHTTPDFTVSRIIFILALIPAAILIFGCLLDWTRLLGGVFRNSAILLTQQYYGLFGIASLGYLMFIAALALQYRDFSTMKAVYIYPAVLCFLFLFLEAASRLYGFLSKNATSITYLVNAIVVLLIGAYTIDVLQMIIHLYQLNVR